MDVGRVGQGALNMIASRSRGTPRVALRLLRRVHDFAIVRGDGKVVEATVEAALQLESVDSLGLDALDRSYLRTLATVYEGGPVGVPPSDRARENIDEIVDEGAGLDARPTGVVDLLFPRVGATSCSIFLMIGSSERSVERCIQVPVLISSSCFFRQRMQTQMTWNVKKKLIYLALP